MKFNITTVLLDAGGIILDESEHEKLRAGIIVQVLEDIVPGYSISTYYSDVEEAVNSFSPKLYQFVFWIHLKNDKSLFDRLYASHLERWKQSKPLLKLSLGLEDEVRKICRDFKVGIAGQYGHEILDLLAEKSVLDCFSYHLTQDDIFVTKPDARYCEQIVRTIGVTPQECIMVGDRIDNDIIPAKQLGMKTILIRVGLHKNQQPRIPSEMPDVELNEVKGLAEAVVKLARKE